MISCIDKITWVVRRGALAALVVFGAVACGGGGGGGIEQTAPITGPDVAVAPDSTNYTGSMLIGQAVVVDVSAVSSTSMDVSWLPATTDAALASKIKYQVHVASDSGFTPGSATLKAEVMGSSARITGLQAATRYYVVVLALDPAGKSTVSAPLSIAMPVADNQAVPGVAVTVLPSENVSSVGSNQVTLTSAPAVGSTAVGQIVVSDSGNGFLSQVTSVNTVAGQTVIQTQPVAISQVVKDLSISSSISLASLPATTATQAGIAVTNNSGGAQEWNWPQSKFRLSGKPVQRTSANAPIAMQAGAVSSGSMVDVSTKIADGGHGSWTQLTAPDTIGVLTESIVSIPTNLMLSRTIQRNTGPDRKRRCR